MNPVSQRPQNRPADYPLELPDVRTIALRGFGVIGVVLLLLTIWVTLAPLSGAVIASGAIRVDDSRKTVAHLEGGIVDEILVRDGDRVRVGQVLVRMRDASVSASVDLLSSQYRAELARIARLQAERDGNVQIFWPPELLRDKRDAKTHQIMRGEERLFKVRLQAVNEQIRSLESQLVHAHQELKDYEAGIASGSRAVTLAKEDLVSNEKLVEKNYISKQRLMILQRDIADTESRLSDRYAEMAQARQRISDIEARMVTLKANRVQQSADELEQSRRRAYDLQERLRPSEDAHKRLLVLAPVTGEVVGLRIHTVGGVVSPREPLLDIVPEDKSMIIEGRVAVEDIDEVRSGSAADVRLTAYPQRNAPILNGVVSYVSADRIDDPKANIAYFSVHIKVDMDALTAYPELKLQPGMPVEAFIRTRERTMFDYLLSPLMNSMRRAARES